jgi:hypothetical protein
LTAAASTTAPALDIGRVARRTFDVLGRRGLVAAGLAVAFNLAPMGVLIWAQFNLSPVSTGSARMWLDLASIPLGYLCTGFTRGALIQLTAAELGGVRARISDVLHTAARSWALLIAISLLADLAALAGFVLLVVPGVILSLAWSVKFPAQVLEGKGVIGSLRRSWKLTGNRRGSILGLGLAYSALSVVLNLSIKAAFGVPLFQSSRPAPGATLLQIFADGVHQLTWNAAVAALLVSTIDLVIGTVGTTAIYLELRRLTEGGGGDTLASVFD